MTRIRIGGAMTRFYEINLFIIKKKKQKFGEAKTGGITIVLIKKNKKYNNYY